jgi:hypothetical protein
VASRTVRKTILGSPLVAPAALNESTEAAATPAMTINVVSFTASLSSQEMKLFRHRAGTKNVRFAA